MRKYDAEIGRFLSVDPLFESQPGYTPYHYAYNDPLNGSDGSGMFTQTEAISTACNGGCGETGCRCASGSSITGGDDGGVSSSSGGGSPTAGGVASTAGGGFDVLNTWAGYGLHVGQRLLAMHSVPVGMSGLENSTSVRSSGGSRNSGRNTDSDYLVYNGTQVNWHSSDGTIIASYAATSGLPEYQNSMFQDVKDAGPIPEGNYTINLAPNPDRIAKADPRTGEILRGDGIQKIPEEFVTRDGRVFNYPGWGSMRVALSPHSRTHLINT